MRAAVLRVPGEALVLEERADPVPGPGEVVLRVGRCGICGSDLHMSKEARFAREGGFVFGHEYAGEVVALGPGVDRLSVGDRVASMPITGCGECGPCRSGRPAYCATRRLEQGGYAELAIARARECVVLPKGVSDAAGALIEPMAVGLHGLNLAGLRPGARVLVLGAGPIGLMTVFWARRLGAGPVTVSARSRRGEALARAVGASGFVASDDLSPQALADEMGGAPEVIFDCIGAPGVIARAIPLLARGGTLVVQGIMGGEDRFVPREAIAQEARIQFSAFFDLREFTVARDALASGDLRPLEMVTDTIPLAALPERFAQMQREGGPGKVLVDPAA